MALNKALTDERSGLRQTNCLSDTGDPLRPEKLAPGTAPGESGSAPEENSDCDIERRLERINLNKVKAELRRAELAFLSAKRILITAEARDSAQRIADALGRCNLSVDNVAKGAAIYSAVETLERVSKFDPNTHLAEFVQFGGRSMMLASRALANCGVASIEYWGRQLLDLTGKFASLPTTQAG